MRKGLLLKYLAPLTMACLAFRAILLDVRGGCGALVRAADTSCLGLNNAKKHRLNSFRGGASAAAAADAPSSEQQKIYRTLQVQIIHRHGDRTPITPLKDEDYWAKTLIPQDLIDKISSNTNVLTTGEDNNHVAGGRGAFGKLTQLGLFQLVDLGTKLREELVSDQHYDDPTAYVEVDIDAAASSSATTSTTKHKYYRYPWHPRKPLHPDNIKVISTNFPRTIQSVQGLLVGLFPDGTDENVSIDIDARYTDVLIPDPQPRRSSEQTLLESALAKQPHLKLREQEMRPLAIRTTAALLDTLGEGALGVSFGVGEEKDDSDQPPRLGWAQLAEITKCLTVRDILPATISVEDQETISKHTAWRWFESLRHPRLAYLAMNPMVSRIIDAMHQHETEPPVIIYSAHDSTLIGLLCGFRLEQPSVWPEYGSYLKMELLEVETVGADINNGKEHVVRFSLNGSLLRSMWDKDEAPMMEIPLRLLTHKTKTEGAAASSEETTL